MDTPNDTNIKNKSSNKVMMLIIIGLILSLVGTIAFFVLTQDEYPECEDDTNVTNDTTVTDIDDSETAKLSTFKLNDGSINIPQGWELTSFASKYEKIDDKIADYCPGGTGGTWPIHKETSVTLSNEESSLTLSLSPLFVPGGFGGAPTKLSEEYEVFKAPELEYSLESTARDMYGAARKQTDDQYHYVLIIMNSEYDPSIDSLHTAEYINLTDGLASMAGMIFEGDQTDLEVADSFYIDACVENSSGLCTN